MNRIVLVTGMAGAGRTTALKVLEDLGFEAVDNLPIGLLRKLVQAVDPLEADLAIGIDPRSRTFDVDALVTRLERLRSSGAAEVRLLFMDCDDEVLRRRYSETRRRHPLAFDRSIEDGIAHERQILVPVRELADHVIDFDGADAGRSEAHHFRAFRPNRWAAPVDQRDVVLIPQWPATRGRPGLRRPFLAQSALRPGPAANDGLDGPVRVTWRRISISHPSWSNW